MTLFPFSNWCMNLFRVMIILGGIDSQTYEISMLLFNYVFNLNFVVLQCALGLLLYTQYMHRHAQKNIENSRSFQ